MKKLQSLKEDAFKDLEGFKIENLRAIKGGMAGTSTGAGEKDSNGGCLSWTSDETITSGPNEGKTVYYGLKFEK